MGLPLRESDVRLFNRNVWLRLCNVGRGRHVGLPLRESDVRLFNRNGWLHLCNVGQGRHVGVWIYYITHNEKIYDPNSYIRYGVGSYPVYR